VTAADPGDDAPEPEAGGAFWSLPTDEPPARDAAPTDEELEFPEELQPARAATRSAPATAAARARRVRARCER
jgi:hypothetical protein